MFDVWMYPLWCLNRFTRPSSSMKLRTRFGTWRRDMLKWGRPYWLLRWRNLGQTFLRVLFGYRFRVAPYLCCSYGNPNLSILLWSYRVIPNFVRTVPRWKDVNENSTAVPVLLTSSDGLFTQSFPHWNGSPRGSLTIETNWPRISSYYGVAVPMLSYAYCVPRPVLLNTCRMHI